MAAEKSGNVLKYNPVRMKAVTNYLLRHPDLKKMRHDMATMDEIELNRNYGEVAMRNLLLCDLLLCGGGKRPSTCANLKVGEMLEADRAENGLMVCRVVDHKTSDKYGDSKLTFYMEDTYSACINYMNMFRYINLI
jgi:hypothetical protein